MAKFKKGESGNPGGRPPKTVTWKEAEVATREAVAHVMLMTDAEVKTLQSSKTTVEAERLALAYIREHPVETINRFLGKTPDVIMSEPTGKDGDKLMLEYVMGILTTEQLERLIEATNPPNMKPPAPPAAPALPAPKAEPGTCDDGDPLKW